MHMFCTYSASLCKIANDIEDELSEADGFLRAMETELRNIAKSHYTDVMQLSRIEFATAFACVGKLKFTEVPPSKNEETLLSLFHRNQDVASNGISESHLRQSMALVSEAHHIGQLALNDIRTNKNALSGASLLIVDTNQAALIAGDVLRLAERQTCRRAALLVALTMALLVPISYLTYLLLKKKCNTPSSILLVLNTFEKLLRHPSCQFSRK